jgi:hypothetical protein
MMGPSSSRDLAVRDVAHVTSSMVWRASQQRGVACIATWGEVRGTKARGRKRRRREGRVAEDCMREASFPTNLAPVGLCGP